MGGYFSGWHGRRSSRPYFDELPRLTVADCKPYPPGLLRLSWKGGTATAWKIIVRAGCMTAPCLQCAKCLRACKVLFATTAGLCCNHCTDARYRTTCESPTRRAVRRAKKIIRRCKIEPGRKGWKPKWMRWATYERLHAEAEAVSPIIEADEVAPHDALARLEAKIERIRNRAARRKSE